ncbi:hypothetical protein CBL_04280 [Carabus blaptoides fortunei]
MEFLVKLLLPPDCRRYPLLSSWRGKMNVNMQGDGCRRRRRTFAVSTVNEYNSHFIASNQTANASLGWAKSRTNRPGRLNGEERADCCLATAYRTRSSLLGAPWKQSARTRALARRECRQYDDSHTCRQTRTNLLTASRKTSPVIIKYLPYPTTVA